MGSLNVHVLTNVSLMDYGGGDVDVLEFIHDVFVSVVNCYEHPFSVTCVHAALPFNGNQLFTLACVTLLLCLSHGKVMKPN